MRGQQLVDFLLPRGQGFLVQSIVDEVAALVISEKPGVAHYAQVLGDSALCNVQPRSQRIDAQCAALEKLYDFHTRLDRQYLEQSREFFRVLRHISYR